MSKPIQSSYGAIVAMSVYQEDRLSWLIEAVDSVLQQDYDDFLFVIHQDGPVPEEVSQYLERLETQHENVKRLVSAENGGLGKALNTIIDWAACVNPKYIIRMDSDDICLPGRFYKQIEFLEQNPDIDVLGTSLTEVNEIGQQVGRRYMPEHHNLLMKVLARRCPLNHPTVVIRYESLLKYGSYDPSHTNTQDYYLWIKMVSQGAKLSNLREPLLKFRRVDGFYKRRGFVKSVNELKARFLAMNKLRLWTPFNVFYALMVFGLRMMPPQIVKAAYYIDRKLIHGKHK